MDTAFIVNLYFLVKLKTRLTSGCFVNSLSFKEFLKSCHFHRRSLFLCRQTGTFASGPSDRNQKKLVWKTNVCCAALCCTVAQHWTVSSLCSGYSLSLLDHVSYRESPTTPVKAAGFFFFFSLKRAGHNVRVSVLCLGQPLTWLDLNTPLPSSCVQTRLNTRMTSASERATVSPSCF